jgi:hypothetical protein
MCVRAQLPKKHFMPSSSSVVNSNAQTFALPIVKNFMTLSLLNGSQNNYIV